MHDGKKNTTSLKKDGRKFRLLPMKKECRGCKSCWVMMCSSKEFLKEVKETILFCWFSLGQQVELKVRLPKEVQSLLMEYEDIML